MISFTWRIRKLKCLETFSEQQNVVKTVYWACTASKDELSREISGSTQLEFTGESFTSFDSLSEQQVLEWCWNSSVKKQSVESAAEYELNSALMYQASNSDNKDVPW